MYSFHSCLIMSLGASRLREPTMPDLDQNTLILFLCVVIIAPLHIISDHITSFPLQVMHFLQIKQVIFQFILLNATRFELRKGRLYSSQIRVSPPYGFQKVLFIHNSMAITSSFFDGIEWYSHYGRKRPYYRHPLFSNQNKYGQK